MAKRDYYEILGVSKNASQKELKKAYRKKAMQFHPDRYEGSKKDGEEKFKELNEAYSVLSDPEKKQIYDRFGHAGLQGSASPRSGDPFEFFKDIFGGDIFGSFFGGGFGRQKQHRRGPSKGEDVILDLELSFEEVYSGVSKKIRMPFKKACPRCMGNGAEPSSTMKTCSNCHGQGVVQNEIRQGFFVQISTEPCRQCRGRGEIPKTKCKECKGLGVGKIREEITVRIPRGIDEGEAVRVQGKGRPSNDGGLPGDLIFRIHLREHDHFQRNGLDIYMKLPVDYPTMVLGGTVEAPVIGGKGEKKITKLKVKAGTKLNDIIKAPKHGFNRKIRGNDVTGDAYYVVDLNVPSRVSKKAKTLLKELQQELK